jgi:hypothetical protein
MPKSRTTQDPSYVLDIVTDCNSRIGKSTVQALDSEGSVLATDRGNLDDAAEQRKVARNIAKKLGCAKDEVLKRLAEKWNEGRTQQRRFREQQATGSPEAVAVETIGLLDADAKMIRRPLCLIDGTAYAAAWGNFERVICQSVENGVAVKHDPPRVSVERALLVLRSDGSLFADVPLPEAQPLASLGLEIRLPSPLPPGREWSGAGVKHFLAGERPDPAEVFACVAGVVDRFLDFARSLAPQATMCEMVACAILSTYLLDALNVVGYLWPSGEHGAGKTTFLEVNAELSYLGQVILAGSSYPCLRDLADYGATLAFDDAEAVMDTRRTDPDKRTLLLAGSRKGATVAVKELVGDKWETRHVNTFCPRLFSAIRTPDEVLGSRAIMVPLVRSGDPHRAKANPMAPEDWPTNRRQLIDDLWALGLTHLPKMAEYDRYAANEAQLSGRNLDPWRPILAVAAWLEDLRAVEGIYDRMEKLSRDYQMERGDIEESDRTRVLFRALLDLSTGWGDGPQKVQPKVIAEAMNKIAQDEDLAEPDKLFTTPRKVGWLLKRQRFRRPKDRSEDGKVWEMSRAEIVLAAKAYGVQHVTT